MDANSLDENRVLKPKKHWAPKTVAQSMPWS
jgi:hypothetical protein